MRFSYTSRDEKHFVVLLHLHEEQDLSFLLRVLYYWEQRNLTKEQLNAKYPKTLQEYNELQEKSSIKDKQKKKLIGKTRYKKFMDDIKQLKN